jgi:hypothetical protein
MLCVLFQVLQQKDDIDLISSNAIAATENVKVSRFRICHFRQPWSRPHN